MIVDFPHRPPEKYSYDFEDFKRNIVAVWIVNHTHFDYCGKSGVKSIWGFYNTKTKEYFAPVNSKTVGKRVNIQSTTPYSAMQLKLTPLEKCFV
jgi:hypothetical protein